MANEIRAGLGQPESATPTVVVAKTPIHPLDEQWFGKSVRRHIQEFAAIFGVIFLVVCGVKTYNGAPLSSCGLWFALAAVTVTLGYTAPSVLRPVWRGWMKLAHYLSIVMTTVILGLAWVIGFIPMSLIVKMCGIKVIDQSFRAPVDTYWVTRDTKYDDFKRLQQQF